MPKLNLKKIKALPGRAYPVGPMLRPGGVRFSVVSRHATRVWLALFNDISDAAPVAEFEMDNRHRTGDVWSIFIEGLRAGALYMYRMDGPYVPEKGHRYNPGEYLLDPRARLIVGNVEERTAKCAVVDDDEDWFDDTRPHTPVHESVIYEMHVRGFSIDPSSGTTHPGSYNAIVEKIPYLKELGVTALELLPVQEIGEDRLGRCSLTNRQELRNYWGYNSIGFYAPTGRYGSVGGMGEQLNEFRDMVRALHSAGIEVILDVVFNHTSEGSETGPTLCFRGIDNSIYYLLDENGEYVNYSGCGNTMNCNHPIVRDLILDCLRYWVVVMHVDGFRFDLASILGRDRKGMVKMDAPLIERIAEDPVLRDTKLIAEAWDAGGAYQVGSFGDTRWAEWNGKYRDHVRQYWRGDSWVKGEFATRIAGSADLYQWAGRTPEHSVNFITSHDGFTLRDLVTYNVKHNEANGENNRDGCDFNFSWNCGVEGDTQDPEVLALRLRMQKNLIATLFLSLGVPMLLGGDEFGRTQRGNNNAYCQDNEISWFDWKLAEENTELFRFTREMIRFRKENPVFMRHFFFDGRMRDENGLPDILWLGADARPMNWSDPSPLMACLINSEDNSGVFLYMIFNPTLTAAPFTLPRGDWQIRVNTACPAPCDVLGPDELPPLPSSQPMVAERKSLVVLSCDGTLSRQDLP